MANASNVIQNITMGRLTNITTQWGGFTSNQTAPPDWGRILWEIVSIYPDAVGPLAWFILFSLPFVMMWLSQADMVPAACVAFFFGMYALGFLDYQYFYYGLVLMVLAMATIVWSLWQKRP
jgi:hypothetical protein